MAKKEEPKIYRFPASFERLTTSKDGGIKVTLCVGDVDAPHARELMDYKGQLFDVIITIVEPETFGGSRFSMEGRETPDEVSED
jgi:hypothetical protein